MKLLTLALCALSLASCTSRSDASSQAEYQKSVAAWLHVQPVTPTVRWFSSHDELAASHPSIGDGDWCYSERDQTIYAYHMAREDSHMRHEVFHALHHACLGQVPAWLDEGTASLTEGAQSGQLLTFHIDSRRIQRCADRGRTLAQIMAYQRSDFTNWQVYDDAYAACAWLESRGMLVDALHGAPVVADQVSFAQFLKDNA